MGDTADPAAWGRHLRAFWRTLPVFLWLFAVGPLLVLYVLLIYVPLTLLSAIMVAVLPRPARRVVMSWVMERWLPHIRGLGDWYVTRFWNGVRAVWRREFGVELPPS